MVDEGSGKILKILMTIVIILLVILIIGFIILIVAVVFAANTAETVLACQGDGECPFDLVCRPPDNPV